MSKRCDWCGRTGPTVEEIEIQAGAYKTTRHPTTGQTAKICTRLPVTAWACGTHRGLALDAAFKAPRATKADGEGQGTLL
jgi:hypothetical protein